MSITVRSFRSLSAIEPRMKEKLPHSFCPEEVGGDRGGIMTRFFRYVTLRFVTIWVFVCHLDREEALFNPNCRTLHLLEDIKRRCNCAENGTVSGYN